MNHIEKRIAIDRQAIIGEINPITSLFVISDLASLILNKLTDAKLGQFDIISTQSHKYSYLSWEKRVKEKEYDFSWGCLKSVNRALQAKLNFLISEIVFSLFQDYAGDKKDNVFKKIKTNCQIIESMLPEYYHFFISELIFRSNNDFINYRIQNLNITYPQSIYNASFSQVIDKQAVEHSGELFIKTLYTYRTYFAMNCAKNKNGKLIAKPNGKANTEKTLLPNFLTLIEASPYLFFNIGNEIFSILTLSKIAFHAVKTKQNYEPMLQLIVRTRYLPMAKIGYRSTYQEKSKKDMEVIQKEAIFSGVQELLFTFKQYLSIIDAFRQPYHPKEKFTEKDCDTLIQKVSEIDKFPNFPSFMYFAKSGFLQKDNFDSVTSFWGIKEIYLAKAYEMMNKDLFLKAYGQKTHFLIFCRLMEAKFHLRKYEDVDNLFIQSLSLIEKGNFEGKTWILLALDVAIKSKIFQGKFQEILKLTTQFKFILLDPTYILIEHPLNRLPIYQLEIYHEIASTYFIFQEPLNAEKFINCINQNSFTEEAFASYSPIEQHKIIRYYAFCGFIKCHLGKFSEALVFLNFLYKHQEKINNPEFIENLNLLKPQLETIQARQSLRNNLNEQTYGFLNINPASFHSIN